MSLIGTSDLSRAQPTITSVEPLRGQIGECTVTWDLTVGGVVNHNSYTAVFFQTGSVTTKVYTGLDYDGATMKASQLTLQDTISVATGNHGTSFMYVSRSRRASVRQVAGRMYEIVYVDENRTVTEGTAES